MADIHHRPRSGRLLRLAAAVLCLGLSAGPLGPVRAQADHPWTETRSAVYVLGDVGPVPGGAVNLVVGGCYPGTVCLGQVAGDYFSVLLDDDSGRTVGGVIHIWDRTGTVFVRPFCGSSGNLPVVPGDMRIILDAPGDVRGAHWYGGPGCTEIRPVGGSTVGATTMGVTSGRVHATFTERGG